VSSVRVVRRVEDDVPGVTNCSLCVSSSSHNSCVTSPLCEGEGQPLATIVHVTSPRCEGGGQPLAYLALTQQLRNLTPV